MNVGGTVEAQAVDMIFLEPHKDVVEDILSDLVASVIGTGVSPRRMRPVIVVEIDSTVIVLGPAVELPKIEIPRAKVVVNNIEDHCDAISVGALDELLEPQRASIGELDRKDMGGIVAPRPVSRELGYRHDLDRVDAELFQMSQTGRYRGELAG
jgi:hypothetical protein